MDGVETLTIIRKIISDFCDEFVKNPYLCYTEHGLHALFFAMLMNSIPEENRYFYWQGQKVCILQKEYPTAGKLGKPQRQHWDLVILKTPPESLLLGLGSYDYFKIFAAIEFGLNEPEEHLKDDIDRLCHKESNIKNRFIIHLYRLSKSGTKFSGRDWPQSSPRIIPIERVHTLITGKSIEVYYGLTFFDKSNSSGTWSSLSG